MRIAILANNYASFVKPMAEGLAKMLSKIDEQPKVYYNGWHYLRTLASKSKSKNNFSSSNASKVRSNLIFLIKRILRPVILRTYKTLENELSNSDVIVVVVTIPTAFERDYLGIEELRQKFKFPVVLYNSVNPAAHAKYIKKNLKNNRVGLERYDWYLLSSVISQYPLPKYFNIFSLIGLDLRDHTLYPDQKEFLAVLDFPGSGLENERAIQIRALEETNSKYYVLDRPMAIEEVRKIYRRCCLFFMSTPESFGLPIVELQLCGSYIAAPYKSWVSAHFLNKNLYERGDGDLGQNFIIYNNDKELLKKQITQIRLSYDPFSIIKEFATSYPHLHHGDKANLMKFISLIKQGIIHADSHKNYYILNKQVDTCAEN